LVKVPANYATANATVAHPAITCVIAPKVEDSSNAAAFHHATWNWLCRL
jgi:hypothetical protein